jgi:hypothetical protein
LSNRGGRRVIRLRKKNIMAQPQIVQAIEAVDDDGHKAHYVKLTLACGHTPIVPTYVDFQNKSTPQKNLEDTEAKWLNQLWECQQCK